MSFLRAPTPTPRREKKVTKKKKKKTKEETTSGRSSAKCGATGQSRRSEEKDTREHLEKRTRRRRKEKRARFDPRDVVSVKRRFTAESLDEEMNGDDYSNSSSMRESGRGREEGEEEEEEEEEEGIKGEIFYRLFTRLQKKDVRKERSAMNDLSLYRKLASKKKVMGRV